jgi:DNA-binding transcriptional regulator YhcF (GntR family)
MENVHKKGADLRVDPDDSRSVVEQIVAGLREALIRRDLKPGDRLPSSRALARDLGVHFNTVAQAYRSLESEGWLQLQRRRGTVVLDRRPPEPGREERARLEQAFQKQLNETISRFVSLGLDHQALTELADKLINEGRKPE